jgi:hypothetical protein
MLTNRINYSEKVSRDLENLEQFTQNLQEITKEYTVTTENKIDETDLKRTASALVGQLAAIKQTTFDHAMIGLASLIQSGAHLRSVQNRRIKIRDLEFTKKDLLFASDQINNPFTLRTIAKGLNKVIASTAMDLKLPGNLYSKFKLEHPNHKPDFNNQEMLKIAVYCTDFQYENPDTPELVKIFLSNRLTRE